MRSCNGCRFEFRNVSPPGSEFGNCYQVECPRGDCYLSLAGGWVWRQSSGGSSLDGPRQSARLDVCKSRSPFSQDWRVLFTILTVQVCISFIQRINNSSIQKVKNVLFVVNKCFVLLFFFNICFNAEWVFLFSPIENFCCCCQCRRVCVCWRVCACV